MGQTGTIKGGVVTAQGRALTPAQMNILRQQAILKKTQQDNAVAQAQAKARMQGMQIGAGTSSAAGMTPGTITTSAVMTSGTPQKVTVTGVSLAPSNLVTVVTQSGHPKTHFIRHVSTGPGGKSTTNIRTMTEADMKLLLATKQPQQQLQTINSKGQVTQLQGNLAAQLLAGGIHVQQHTGAGGAQVATLVKTVNASGSGGVAVVGTGGQVQPSVTIPVANVNLPQVKAALARTGVTNQTQMQLALRQQIIQQQRKPVTTTLPGTQQKVTLGQVGAKGVPAQLIVSSSGAVSAAGQKQMPQQQAVTVQQYQQIVKSVQQPGVVSASGSNQQQIVTHSQQIMPHAVFTKQAVVSTFASGGTVTGLITTVGGAATTQTSTVQARVIPVSSTSAAGRMQQIQVVAASPSQVQVATTTAVNARQIAGAPNVTVDSSGRPTGATFVNAAGTQHIRVATSGNQQFMTTSGQNVSVAVRGPVGVLATHHQQQQQHQQQQIVTSQHGGVTKLQVVGPSTTTTVAQPTDRS